MGGVLVVDDGKVEPRAAEALHKAHAGGVKKGADGPRTGGELLFERVFHADSSLFCLDAPIIRAFWRDGKCRAAHICAHRRIRNSGTGDEGMELGIASDWAATGVHQSVKQLTKQK